MVGDGVGRSISKYNDFLLHPSPEMNSRLFSLIFMLSEISVPIRNRNQVTISYVGLTFEDPLWGSTLRSKAKKKILLVDTVMKIISAISVKLANNFLQYQQKCKRSIVRMSFSDFLVFHSVYLLLLKYVHENRIKEPSSLFPPKSY